MRMPHSRQHSRQWNSIEPQFRCSLWHFDVTWCMWLIYSFIHLVKAQLICTVGMPYPLQWHHPWALMLHMRAAQGQIQDFDWGGAAGPGVPHWLLKGCLFHEWSQWSSTKIIFGFNIVIPKGRSTWPFFFGWGSNWSDLTNRKLPPS